MKVATPAKECVEIDTPSGRRVDFRKGIAEVSDRDGRAIVRYGGFVPSMSGVTRAEIGFRCASCGFGSFFSTCSRCGSEAVREAK